MTNKKIIKAEKISQIKVTEASKAVVNVANN